MKFDPSIDSVVAHHYEFHVDDLSDWKPIARFVKYPQRFDHGGWKQIALMPKFRGFPSQLNTRGRKVLVFEGRLPARFHMIVAPPTRTQPGLLYRTGSSMQPLVAKVARALHVGRFTSKLKQEMAQGKKDKMFVQHEWKENYLD